jgi:hypothetical protein
MARKSIPRKSTPRKATPRKSILRNSVARAPAARKPLAAGKRAPGTATRPVSLPRFAKGRRPQFYEDPAIDQLFAIVTALTGEISVLFDRLDTMERLLTESRVLPTQAIEAYVPDEAAATLRAQRRDELLRRVFAVLELYAAAKAAPA